MNRSLHYAVFAAGLAALGWIGAGYAGANPLALAVTLLIGAVYLAGAWELRRFQQATATLSAAVGGTAQPPASLGEWLGQLHPSLRNAARLRVEGERAGLPGPSMAPYLAGLLVLLGMLGTFIGMVATLKGTGAALDGATDLASIRDSLAAPVRGLGLAFGTSVAGVAASAALGLLTALCRRERLLAAQQLDACVAAHLHVFSDAHQREESFKLLQRQAELMPQMLDRLQSWMTAMQAQDQALNERLAAGQDAFHRNAEAAYAGLAASVDRSLQQSLVESARAAGAAIQPVVETTMAGIARETASWHQTLADQVQRQLDGASTRFAAATAAVADTWQGALAEQRRAGEAMSADLRGSLERHAAAFEQGSAALVANVAARLESAVGEVSSQWRGALEQQERGGQALAQASQQALAEQRRVNEALAGDLRGALERHAEAFAERSAALVSEVSGRLEAAVGSVSDNWREALQLQERGSQALSQASKQAFADAAAAFERHGASLLDGVGRAHAELRAGQAEQEQRRFAAWSQSLESMAESLRQESQQSSRDTAEQLRRLGQTLTQATGEVAEQARAQAQGTIAEIAQLVQAAAEAPRAAAEMVAELRQKLSDSMARDNTMLQERARILETLATLLDAVNHASTEQRAAIDSLVASSTQLLDRTAGQFAQAVQAQAEALADTAAHVTGSAVEVASLGEAFGLAVQLFSQSNDKLVDHLQRIEGALGRSIERSDEQLAYYVAQAREVIDLSISSQKQIIEDLQQIAGGRALAGAEA